MSFMFTPLEYDDKSAINRPELSQQVRESMIFGTADSARSLARAIQSAADCGGCAVALDGYVGAQFEGFTNLLTQALEALGCRVCVRKAGDCYRSAHELDEMTRRNTPLDNELDPVNAFGRVYKGTFRDFIDADKAAGQIVEMKALAPGEVLLFTGYGSASETFESALDMVVYIDVTPKTAAVRVRKGQYVNIGDDKPRPFLEIMRRNYYVDFEIVLASRKRLLQQDRIDFYIDGNDPDGFVMLPGERFAQLLRSMVGYPFRCKPVYMEGAWGGEYIRKLRGLPETGKNIAWVYEMIAFEVSLVVEAGDRYLEFPFSTLIQKYPVELMGQPCVDRFGGYFPIRFNYDDTYHGNGNMSIQVHPDGDMIVSEHDEKGSQDESYYVIATGHGARTFVGFHEDADRDEFFRLIRQSEQDGSPVDYQKYINAVDSYPGRQVMMPGGTVHASGRNQLVLEIGSLTTGAYTYKMYDYVRQDLNGGLRPIHSTYAERAVKKDRTEAWVRENAAIEPRLVREDAGCRESIIGTNDYMYFETRKIDLETGGEIALENGGQFTVLTMVDGEEVLVYSKSDPSRCFTQKYLDIVIVPAEIDDFVIQNLGYQPAVIHKTALKKERK